VTPCSELDCRVPHKTRNFFAFCVNFSFSLYLFICLKFYLSDIIKQSENFKISFSIQANIAPKLLIKLTAVIT